MNLGSLFPATALTACLAFSLLAGCTGPRRTAMPEYTLLDTLAVSAKPKPVIPYRATEPRTWDILHTTIYIDFNWAEKTANGRAILRVSPYAAAQTALVLDAKSMDVHSVQKVPSTPTENRLRFRQQGDSLLIDFPQAYTARDTLELEIVYTAKPYAEDAPGSAAIREARGLYFINTDYAIPGKPAQIWTQGETEANSHWFPTIDKPFERFTTDLYISVPDSFATLSNGVKVSGNRVGSGLRVDHWRMDKSIPAYTVTMAIGKYIVVQDAAWHGREVSYYLEPEYAPWGRQIFRHTPEMMEFFSRVTGVAYPWPKYSQVVVRDFVSGAMENTSASTFGEFMYRNGRELLDGSGEDVVSHELFHQWFGDYATAESWSNLTVNESFATYGEVLWRRYKYGADAADELRFSDLQRYLSSTERRDPPLVRFYYENKEEMFDRVSYQKGGAILHYMHRQMGDSLLYRAMNRYLTMRALQPAEAEHWRLAVEDVTGQDWKPFFNQWYNRGGHPRLTVTHLYNDSAAELRVVVAQRTTGDSSFFYDLPMQAAVIRPGAPVTMQPVRAYRARDTFRFAYTGGQRPVVVIDAEHVVVGSITDSRPGVLASQWETIYRAMPDYISRRAALTAVKSKPGAAPGTAVFGLALEGRNADLRDLAVQLLAASSDSSIRGIYAPTLRRIAATDTTPDARASAIRLLSNWKDSSLARIARLALNDSSYRVAGAALTAYARTDEGKAGARAYNEARRILPTVQRGELWSAALTVIAENAAPADTAILYAQLRRPFPVQRSTVAGRLVTLAARTSDTAVTRQIIDVLGTTAQAEKEPYGRVIAANNLAQLAATLANPAARAASTTDAAAEPLRALAASYLQRLADAETDAQAKAQIRNMLKMATPSTPAATASPR